MIEILENATVIYADGVEEQFDAIRITIEGVVIGRILDGEFVDCGFISKNGIKEIKNGIKRNITKKIA